MEQLRFLESKQFLVRTFRIRNILNYKKPAFWVIILATIVVGIGIGLLTNPKHSAFDPTNLSANSIEPPKIQISVCGAKINYVVRLNQWNGAAYDRVNTFQTIMKGKRKTDIPYIQLNKEFQIKFTGISPDSVRLQDYILGMNGNAKYTDKEIRTIPIEFKNMMGSFILTAHPAALYSSYSSDYEPGSSIRGFRLTCKYGANEFEYAFIIRSDAR